MEQKHDLLFQVLDRFGGFCSLVNKCNKKSATFIELQRFRVLSNFITKGYRSSLNETAASAWQQQNTDWWSKMK
jgi:hypothetical protein